MNILKNLARFQYKYSSLIFAITIFLTIAIGLGIQNIHLQTDISKELPQDLDVIKLQDRISDKFGGADTIMVLIKLNKNCELENAPKDIRDPRVIRMLVFLENEIKKELGNLSCLEYYEKTADSEFDKERLKERIDKLKAEIFSIGGIDSMVIQEYKETEERYNFLSDQLKDLEKASVSLKHIIAELEDKIESVFSKTFKEINNGFSEYFRILFNGGTARLQLIKSFNRKKNFEKETEEDELGNFKKRENDEGVEIIAVPPGKRIRNLSMLSGGERTLTSIALLFAIISCNPPPFSMLDEIDAALDEANIYRFAKILEQLSQKTQFIIITHNRETMRQASSLYGVTTIDNGISKIISVKLDNIKKDGKTKNVLTNFE